MFSAAWKMLKDTVLAFIDDEALSRGAAIAFYTVTSIAPVLLIVIAIAGLAFGRDAAQNALTEQLSGLMGQQTAEVLQTAVASAASKSSGAVATIIGIITLMVTASGVFGEMQTASNAIWKAKPKGTTVSRLIRARCPVRGEAVATVERGGPRTVSRRLYANRATKRAKRRADAARIARRLRGPRHHNSRGSVRDVNKRSAGRFDREANQKDWSGAKSKLNHNAQL
jgi:hypothetical protein